MVMARTLNLAPGGVIGSDGPLSLPGLSFLEEARMAYARPVHQQQLPTVGSVALLILAMVLVVVPGALTLLRLLISTFIL
jgi:hypothetical protein